MGELTAGSWAGVRVLEDEEYGNGALAELGAGRDREDLSSWRQEGEAH